MKALILTTTLLAFSATATMAAVGDTALPAGQPAGVQRAQLEGGNGMLVVAGAAAIGFAVALSVAGDGAAAPITAPSTTAATTTGTSP